MIAAKTYNLRASPERGHHTEKPLRLDRRHFLTASAGVLGSGCSLTGDGVTRPRFAQAQPLVPLNLSLNHLTRITVCTRPFRPEGPRLETVKFGDKKLVHNYGHGGSGWSLSWGCANEAASLALGDGPKEIAVIGAGVIGMTTALRLIERGVAVTIYAHELPAETRSARATGVWSPSSRIGLASAVPQGFADRWEGWARASYATHNHFVGSVGTPVEYITQYFLRDDPRPPQMPATRDYLHIGRRVRDLRPASMALEPHEHPFPVPSARRWEGAVFNVASYMDRLTRDFLLRGGKMVRQAFPDRAAIIALSEKTVVNCTGFGARHLFDDQSLVPVRGQINWMTPQSTARYGLFYNNVTALSRRDGVIVQYTGPNEDFGYGDDSETPDQEEATEALATLAPLFKS